MATILLALIALQDPIADLDHDDPAVREAAMRELRELRDCAETNLRSRLAAGVSAEAAGRIRSLLGRIERERRIAAFPGGEEVDGLRAAVSIAGSPDDPRRTVRLEIQNVGPGGREIVPVQAWSKRFPSWSSSSGNAEARIVITGGPPERGGRFGASFGCGGRRTPDFVALSPGESRTYEFVLDSKLLKPGRYQLSVHYLALSRLEGTPELASNAVSFVVGSPDGPQGDGDGETPIFDPTVRRPER